MNYYKIIIICSLCLSSLSQACPLTLELWNSLRLAAISQEIEPLFFASLIKQESNFCPDALSHAGAIGLGQLMPDTAEDLGVDPYEPLENILGSATYLRQQYERFGSWHLALAAYNAGPGAVDRSAGIPINGETENFVPAIFRHYISFINNPPFEQNLIASTTSVATTAAPVLNRRADQAVESALAEEALRNQEILIAREPTALLPSISPQASSVPSKATKAQATLVRAPPLQITNEANYANTLPLRIASKD